MQDIQIAPATSVEIRCMQIFGGNQTITRSFDLPGVDVWLESHAHGGKRGGDVHYLSTCAKGEIVRVMIADVAGHGAQVADVAARFRKLIGRNMNRLDMTRMARKLNQDFHHNNSGGRFVTTLFTSYHRPSNHLVICNAGHPRPLLYRARTGRWELLDYRFEDKVETLLNLPLGIIHPTEYYQFAVRLFEGDFVVMYTDGASETTTSAGARGEQRMLGAARQIPLVDAASVARALARELGLDRDGRDVVDDETLLVLSPTMAEMRPMTLGERMSALGKMAGLVPVDVPG